MLDLADMHQRTTQSYVRRPYGVGMLVAAHDQTGPHLFQTCPSGNYFEYIAMAIGARSQSAKTYLEKHFESFEVGARANMWDGRVVKNVVMTYLEKRVEGSKGNVIQRYRAVTWKRRRAGEGWRGYNFSSV